jgi:hypothetical protein
MSMSSFGCNGWVISYEELKKICPKEINDIESDIYFNKIGWGDLARSISFKDKYYGIDYIVYSFDEEVSDEKVELIYENYVSLVENLCKSFNEKTDLRLEFDYYNDEEGGRYDTVENKDGCVFSVGGMTILSPAGEKLKDIVQFSNWTQFG